MKKRKFSDGGETVDMEPSEKPEGGRFSSDTYKRAFAQVNEPAKDAPKPAAKAKAKPAAKSADPTAGEAKDKAAQEAADRMGNEPAKRPSMMARLRADSAKREAAVTRMREETPDLRTTGNRTTTDDKMSPKYGQGRTNPKTLMPLKCGGKVAKYAKGGSIDGIAQRGKTKGRVC